MADSFACRSSRASDFGVHIRRVAVEAQHLVNNEARGWFVSQARTAGSGTGRNTSESTFGSV
jgi:hypothetical protein